MVSFYNDYSEGAHPKILEKLIKATLEQNAGYGLDVHTKRACDLMKEAMGRRDVDIPFSGRYTGEYAGHQLFSPPLSGGDCGGYRPY